MKTRNSILLTLALGLAGFSAASPAAPDQTPTTPQTVSISASNSDVRTVLHDLFTQVKQNFVLEPNIRFAIFLTLDKVEFDEALAIVCHLAKLKAEKQNGIYYVSNDTTPTTPVKPKDTPRPIVDDGPPPVTQTTLKTKHVTTRLAKTDIRKVFAAISKEAGIPITVDGSVPTFKMDAFLQQTTLKYALDQIAGAAKLRYRIVDKQSILIYADDTENRVAVRID